jgi:hypothetical protein
MTELFDIPETPSPRLRWMQRHHLTVESITGEGADNGNRYAARHGMTVIGKGATEDEALTAAAKSLNIRLWNEEGVR